MPFPVFSPQWAAAFKDAVNADADFRDVARKWSDPVALVVDATAERAATAVQVELHEGTCLGATALPPDDVTAPFVLAAPLRTWHEIMHGALDPLSAVARGSVKLTRGSLGTLMVHSRTARALLVCARGVDTDWPDVAS